MPLHSSSSTFVAPQGTIPCSNVPSPSHQCTMKWRRREHPPHTTKYRQHPVLAVPAAQHGRTTNCYKALVHRSSEKQHKPENCSMCFFSTINRLALSRTTQGLLTRFTTAAIQNSYVFVSYSYWQPSCLQTERKLFQIEPRLMQRSNCTPGCNKLLPYWTHVFSESPITLSAAGQKGRAFTVNQIYKHENSNHENNL